MLGHPVVKTVIPGANSAEQVRANLALIGTKIPSTLWADLKDQSHVWPTNAVMLASHFELDEY